VNAPSSASRRRVHHLPKTLRRNGGRRSTKRPHLKRAILARRRSRTGELLRLRAVGALGDQSAPDQRAAAAAHRRPARVRTIAGGATRQGTRRAIRRAVPTRFEDSRHRGRQGPTRRKGLESRRERPGRKSWARAMQGFRRRSIIFSRESPKSKSIWGSTRRLLPDPHSRRFTDPRIPSEALVAIDGYDVFLVASAFEGAANGPEKRHRTSHQCVYEMHHV